MSASLGPQAGTGTSRRTIPGPGDSLTSARMWARGEDGENIAGQRGSRGVGEETVDRKAEVTEAEGAGDARLTYRRFTYRRSTYRRSTYRPQSAKTGATASTRTALILNSAILA